MDKIPRELQNLNVQKNITILKIYKECYTVVMGKLILLRHGASVWNEINVFTGWVDIPLSEKGIQESLEAGRKIAHMPIDVIFTSSLIRTQETAVLAMSVHQGKRVPYLIRPHQGKLENWAEIYSRKTKEGCLPVIVSWELNERMYGELQGVNKQEMKDRFGEAKVQLWRRSFDVAPPGGESLKMVSERSVPYFKEAVIPYLEKGKNVLIVAHGNSLRSIVMYLDQLNSEEIVKLEIPTGSSLFYSYQKDKWIKERI